MSLKPAAGVEIDAIVCSPHKFVGGPGASGLLVARRSLFTREVPTQPGGGTVLFVSPWHHDYLDELEAREDGGTPAILQAIRCGLAFQVREQVGVRAIETLCARKCARAIEAWAGHDNVSLVGGDRTAYYRNGRLPIVSFQVLFPRDAPVPAGAPTPTALGPACVRAEHGARRFLHPSFVVALLNDLYGIQARAGCSCAGPYGSRLWGFDEAQATRLRRIVLEHGLAIAKPGWSRLNFSWTMTDAEVDFLVAAVCQVADEGWKLLPLYAVDPRTGTFEHRASSRAEPSPLPSLRALQLSAPPSARRARHAGQPARGRRAGPSGGSREGPFAQVLAEAQAHYDRAAELAAPFAREIAGPAGDFARRDAHVLGPGGNQEASEWVQGLFAFPSDALKRLSNGGPGGAPSPAVRAREGAALLAPSRAKGAQPAARAGDVSPRSSTSSSESASTASTAGVLGVAMPPSHRPWSSNYRSRVSRPSDTQQSSLPRHRHAARAAADADADTKAKQAANTPAQNQGLNRLSTNLRQRIWA
mmetsp:Transcript_14806/g.38533  ORF Transcript_14806/g.38533 Transcript_14806/m.38533 type:complete len:531 (-) Transcript_14806:61-1653(-)